MRILIFNWRDIKNPGAGGAEIVTHEHAKRWVRAGHKVTLFCAAFAQAKKEETIDEIDIIRKGNRYTVYWQAFCYYRKYFRGNFDLVIDEINTLPFFTLLYVKEPVIAFIHQLCREIWFYESKLPIAIIGYLIEPLCLKIYRNVPIITVSQSSKKDLVRLGFKEEKIHVIPEGIGFKSLVKVGKKEECPTLVYVGRLKKSKRIHHILQAFNVVKKEEPTARLWLIGNGDPHKKKLENLVKKMRLKDVIFWGFQSEKEKLSLVKRAHVMVMTSVKEGWGLAITEANALSTPAVVYNVSGLCDSTKNNETGLVCRKNTPQVLAENIIRLLGNKPLYKRLQEGAYRWGKKFSWDQSAREALRIVKAVGKIDRPLLVYPKVSIIIPAKERNKDLEECIQRCRMLDYPDYEIIVLPDEEERFIYLKTRVIATGAIGPSEKRDIGIRDAQGEILAFLDDDAFPAEDWLENAVRYFQDKELAALGGPAVTPPTDNLLQKASGLIYSSLLGSGMFSYRYWPGRKRTINDYPSCNFLIRKSIMKKIGGFGSQFWPGEDTLLTLKITKLKEKIGYAPDVLVYHHRRPLFKRHLLQVWGYALHRGYFVKRFPQTSRKLFYFLPSLFLLFLLFGGISALLYPPVKVIYLLLIALYFFSSLITGLKSKNFKLAWLVFLGIPATHLTYGTAFIKGLFSKRLER